jgi:hypothetical protein
VNVIWFNEFFRGDDVETNFPLMIHGVAFENGVAYYLCVGMEGEALTLPDRRVRFDVRWDPKTRDWKNIDLPE